jgi:DNA-binding NarL/FixJ family response regulator
MKDERRARFVLVVEDHPLVSDSLVACVRDLEPLIEIEVADTLQSARGILAARPTPCLIVTDLTLTDSKGIESARRLRAAAPSSALLVVTATDSIVFREQAAELGVIGYVIKSTSIQTLRDEIRKGLGEHPAANRIVRKPTHALSLLLTPKQLSVLEQLAAGRSNKEIALRLQIGDETVSSHMKEILGRLEVRNRTEAVVRYLQLRNQRSAAKP